MPNFKTLAAAAALELAAAAAASRLLPVIYKIVIDIAQIIY